jgi:hypothetical protein
MAEKTKTANLEALGFDQFTPYEFEREPAWILFPLLSLALVVWHLRDLRPRLVGKKLRLHNEKEDGQS